jgi:hypothetical protein
MLAVLHKATKEQHLLFFSEKAYLYTLNMKKCDRMNVEIEGSDDRGKGIMSPMQRRME